MVSNQALYSMYFKFVSISLNYLRAEKDIWKFSIFYFRKGHFEKRHLDKRHLQRTILKNIYYIVVNKPVFSESLSDSGMTSLVKPAALMP